MVEVDRQIEPPRLPPDRPVDLTPLLARAFMVIPGEASTRELDRARELYAARKRQEGFNFEIRVPEKTTAEWLESVLYDLATYCESTERGLPGCAGVFGTLFMGDTSHCVDAQEIVRFSMETLDISLEELHARCDTGLHTAVQLP